MEKKKSCSKPPTRNSSQNSATLHFSLQAAGCEMIHFDYTFRVQSIRMFGHEITIFFPPKSRKSENWSRVHSELAPRVQIWTALWMHDGKLTTWGLNLKKKCRVTFQRVASKISARIDTGSKFSSTTATWGQLRRARPGFKLEHIRSGPAKICSNLHRGLRERSNEKHQQVLC